jgi:hypothetical protein
MVCVNARILAEKIKIKIILNIGTQVALSKSQSKNFMKREEFVMKKKVIYSIGAVLIAAATSAALLAWDLGPGTTPMAKFFLVFFGAIIVLQCIPALLLFGCIIKEIAFGTNRKAALAENQSKNSASS